MSAYYECSSTTQYVDSALCCANGSRCRYGAAKEFGFNAQTAQDNAFQNPLALSAETILQRAMSEFNAMVNGLRQAGVDVVIFDYP